MGNKQFAGIRLNLNTFAGLLRIIFGLIFILSAAMKFTDLEAFTEAIRNFNLVGGILISITQYSIPVIEIILGLALIFNFRTAITSQIATFLLAFFTALIISKLFEGAEVSCGCFGELTSDNIDGFTVIRNIVLMGIGIFLTSFYESSDKDTQNENQLKLNFNKFLEMLKKSSITLVFFLFATQAAVTGVQNRELKDRLILLADSGSENLVAGDTVQSFTINDVNQVMQKVSFPEVDSSKTLLFIMSATCKPCGLTIPHWKRLYQELNAKVKIKAIAMNPYDEIQRYKADHNLPYNIFTISEDSFVTSFKNTKTPQTILINKDGIVERSWIGKLANIQTEEIINYSNNNKE